MVCEERNKREVIETINVFTFMKKFHSIMKNWGTQVNSDFGIA